MTGFPRHEETLPMLRIGAGIMVAASSYLADRVVPAPEIIHLPPIAVGREGALVLESGPGVARATKTRPGGLRGLARRLLGRDTPSTPIAAPDGRLVFDLRTRSPENWAHFLNNHLPLVFHACDVAGLDWNQTLLALPARTPGHILKAAALFGFETLATDAPVSGRVVRFSAEPWIAIRSRRADWARLPAVDAALRAAGVRGGPEDGTGAGRRVFISRRDSRKLANEAEVMALLTARGHTRIYAEDLTPAEQMRLVEEAEEIVAIHGAALAPLLYRSGGARLRRLVELFPCGHVTNVYRAMAEQVGVEWIGVRGRIRPEHIAPAYDFSKPFDRYSLQDFEIDPAALETAFDLLDGADVAGRAQASTGEAS